MNPTSKKPHIICALATTALLLTAVTGCDRKEEISSYKVPKPTAPVAPAGGETAMPPGHGMGMAGLPALGSSGAGGMETQGPGPLDLVQWKVPEGWHCAEQTRPMVLAIFHAGKDPDHLEISVAAFPGQVGGLLANVNRWRGQLQLEPINQEQLAQYVETIQVAGTSGALMDATAPPAGPTLGKRMIGVAIADGAGMSWFIKSTGTPELLEKEKANIRAFAESFVFKNVEPTEVAPPSPAATNADLTWRTPASWQQASRTADVIAAFEITGKQGPVRIIVMTTNGAPLTHLNAARQEVGLEALTQLEDQPAALVDATNLPVIVFDLPGNPTTHQRTLLAMVPQAGPATGTTWFFKMNGAASDVTEQKASFLQFLKSLRLGDQS